MTQRFRDWQSRLQACLAERRLRAFDWGVHDCCLFPCDGVLAMTGHDPAADVRGTYNTERGAMRIVKRLGGMRAIAASRFGAEVPVLMAQVGDIGLLPLEGRESLALCGGGVWLAPGLDQLEVMPLSAAVGAWRCV